MSGKGNRRDGRLIALAALLVATAAAAHHSVSTLDLSKPVWVKATVARYEPRNPHVLIHLEERQADGGVKTRMVDGPIVLRLQRMGVARDLIKPGDVIELCGFPYKENMAEHVTKSAAALPPLHAHLLVLPGGRLQAWGPYGKLDNCVRPRDAARTWIDFVNSAPLAREYWCRGIATTSAPSLAPRALVEEIGRGMTQPCD